MMQLSGTRPEKMLKSLSKEFIFLRSLTLNILQKDMCDWKVRVVNILQLGCQNIVFFIDMDMSEKDCPELTERTADAIDDASLRELFVSTQMNNLGLCVKSGLK